MDDSAIIIEKVAYGMTIGDNKFGNSRPGVVEATLKPGKTLEEALDELDDRLTAWHKKRYPHLYTDGQSTETVRSFTPQQTGASVMPTIDYKMFEQLEIDIDNCQTLRQLDDLQEKYRWQAIPGKIIAQFAEKRKQFVS